MQLMIDIETLDTRVTAKVLSIGYCLFKKTGLYASHVWKLNIDEQDDRTVSQSTLDFWLSQSDEARNALLAVKTTPLETIRREIKSMLSFFNVSAVWTNGPDFDTAILNSLFGEQLWPFYINRCFRTLRDLCPKKFEEPRTGLHSAKDDAVYQARAAIFYQAELGYIKD